MSSARLWRLAVVLACAVPAACSETRGQGTESTSAGGQGTGGGGQAGDSGSSGSGRADASVAGSGSGSVDAGFSGGGGFGNSDGNAGGSAGASGSSSGWPCDVQYCPHHGVTACCDENDVCGVDFGTGCRPALCGTGYRTESESCDDCINAHCCEPFEGCYAPIVWYPVPCPELAECIEEACLGPMTDEQLEACVALHCPYQSHELIRWVLLEQCRQSHCSSECQLRLNPIASE